MSLIDALKDDVDKAIVEEAKKEGHTIDPTQITDSQRYTTVTKNDAVRQRLEHASGRKIIQNPDAQTIVMDGDTAKHFTHYVATQYQDSTKMKAIKNAKARTADPNDPNDYEADISIRGVAMAEMFGSGEHGRNNMDTVQRSRQMTGSRITEADLRRAVQEERIFSQTSN